MPKKPRPSDTSNPTTEHLSSEAQALIDFWKDLVKGKMLVPTGQGKTADVIVPLDIRLRASEQLAKYVMPKQVSANETPIVTNGVLDLARSLEERASPAEVEELLRSLDDSDA